MPRFLTEADYAQYVKPEIKQTITGTTDPNTPSAKQLAAESTAQAMIIKYVGGRYNTDTIFSATGDARDFFIIRCIIVIALYTLYHQTGMKDIPEHRKEDYNDIVNWLRDVGAGDIPTNLPGLYDTDGNFEGEVRINSCKPCNQRW